MAFRRGDREGAEVGDVGALVFAMRAKLVQVGLGPRQRQLMDQRRLDDQARVEQFLQRRAADLQQDADRVSGLLILLRMPPPNLMGTWS